MQVTDDGTEQVLTYTGSPGEVNNLLIEGGPDYQVAELMPVLGGTPVHIAPGANCPAYRLPGTPSAAMA